MRLTSLLLASVLAASSPAFAATYSGIVAFGDSLTDNGNVSIATAGALPGSGYYYRPVTGVPFQVGDYTNPPVGGGPTGLWVDQFAAKLGVADPSPYLAGGSNFAIGSSYTAGFNGLAPGMDGQVGLFLTSTGGTAPSTALYTLWGGGNDILNGLSPTAAADHVAAEIETLYAAGGRTFLWFNQAPLGQLPEVSALGTLASTLTNQQAALFNAEWAAQLSILQGLGINVIGVDVNALFAGIIANPTADGFTNITNACLVTAGCNPNTFLFWDGEHPTTYADSFVATLAYQDLTRTPEPASLMLLGTGVLSLAASRLRRRA